MTSATLYTKTAQVLPAETRRESKRRFVVRAVFFLFALMLVEGPLRKWALPGLSGPLVLLRDPFALALYAYCFANGLIWMRGLAGAWLALGWITAMLGLAQYMVNGYGFEGWMLGVRTYWLYMPLAFVVARAFEPEDVHRLLRWILIIAVPYSLLVATQYNAPPFAFVNQGVAKDTSAAVRVAEGIFRPFGLFTYTGPNVQYTTFTVAIFFAFYLSGLRVKYHKLFLAVTACAVGAMSVLTGSRGIYFIVGVTIFFTVGGLLAMRPGSHTFRRTIGIVGFVAFAGTLFVTVFPDMFTAMELRFERAARSESMSDRVLGVFTRWTDPLFTAPILGHGIGLGAPGVANYLGVSNLLFGEGDLQRNVNELGVLFGLVLIVMRWVTAIWLYLASLRLAGRGIVLALPLAGFAAVPLTVGQITHSPYLAFLPWVTLGMVACLMRHTQTRHLGYKK